jgi:ERCC4-type nuclease
MKEKETEEERAKKAGEEKSKAQDPEDSKASKDPALHSPEEKKPEKPTPKTKVVVAIDERELNKVELAYFKRPMNLVILSDK